MGLKGLKGLGKGDEGVGKVGVGLKFAFLKIVVFYSKREKTSSKHEVFYEKLKTVLPAVILKKKKSRLPSSQNLPGPLRDLVKSLLGLFGFSHSRLLHRICKTRHFKISKNYRFFNQKEHLPAQNLSFA